MVKEIIYSVISTYGVSAIVVGVGFGIKALKNIIGAKKFDTLMKDTREIVADAKKLNKDLGLEEVENYTVERLLKWHKNVELVQECVKKVLTSVDSMTDDTIQQSAEQNVPEQK